MVNDQNSPVLIISDHSDAHVPMVGRHLEEMGVPLVQLNTSDFPLRNRLCIAHSRVGSHSTLYLPGNVEVDCSAVRSIWYRKPEPYEVAPAVSEDQREFATAECREALHGIYSSLRGKSWIDDPVTMGRASNKSLQIDLASKLGFEIPKTLITNDPKLALDFFDSCHSGMVYKTLSEPRINSSSASRGSQSILVYTTLVTDRDPELWASVKLAPCLFQEYVAKYVEVRVTVVGTEVFAAEIHSQGDALSAIDWRQGDIGDIKHRAHALPDAIANLCRRLLLMLQLKYGAIDLILTPDSRYVFLEINPNGQYGWIEYLTGLPISESIAECLAAA